MKKYTAAKFALLQATPGIQARLENMEFVRCAFRSCHLGGFLNIEHRPVVRNVRLHQCRVEACAVSEAILDTVDWDDCLNTDLLHISGCAFRHVTIRGRSGPILINGYVETLFPTGAQQAFDAANNRFYSDVDWALDIREFAGLDLHIESVPTRLIRRNPETQIVVRRDRLTDQAWRALPLEAGVSRVVLGDLMESPEDSRVFVAPPLAGYFEQQMRDFELLRRAGIAE